MSYKAFYPILSKFSLVQNDGRIYKSNTEQNLRVTISDEQSGKFYYRLSGHYRRPTID